MDILTKALTDKNISHAAFRTLIALLLYGDQGLRALARKLGRAHANVRQDIECLIAHGYLVREGGSLRLPPGSPRLPPTGSLGLPPGSLRLPPQTQDMEESGENEGDTTTDTGSLRLPPALNYLINLTTTTYLSGENAKNEPANVSEPTPKEVKVNPPDVADRVWRGIVKKALIIPPSARDRVVPVIDAALARNGYDEEKTIADGRHYYETWCSRRNKDGAYYSPHGLGWLDWWASGMIPEARNGDGKKDNARGQKMDDLLRKRRELAEKEKRHAQG